MSDSPPPHATAEAVQYSLTGLRYPEWDFRIGAYHPNAATVQVRRPRSGDPDWVETIQRRYAGLIAQVMRCFERLRPRRCRQGQQPDGTDIDIAAYVAAHADRQAGLEPESYTRTGAALRHATTLLTKQSVRHQLLLLLSDGKPNDMDLYEGRYGVEDTRQAVAEATLQGVTVFCLTIDREAPAYISRIFGPCSYAILRQPERLPTVLLDLVRQLLPQSA